MHTGRRRCLGGLLAASGVATWGSTGCANLAGPQTLALQRNAPDGLPERHHLGKVPFVPQGDELCGPASLAMLLGHAGRPADLAELTRQTYLPGRHGSLQLEMLATLRRQGLVAHGLPPRLEAVLRQVAAGEPVLLLLNLSLPWLPRWHYAVLLGYDLPAGQAWLHSGEHANQRWSLDTLEHTWARSQHWAVVALPVGRLPAEPTPERLATALLGFERAAGAVAAETGWRQAQARFASHLPLALALGNNLMAQQRWAEAQAHWQTVLAQHASAVAWNNLALCLHQQGRRAEAAQALDAAEQRCAQAEPQWCTAIAQTRAELGQPSGQ